MKELIQQALASEYVQQGHIEFEVNGKPVKFSVLHNLPGDTINAAFENWGARTREFTGKSFCAYINSKRERGMSDHICILREDVERELGLKEGEWDSWKVD